MTRQQGLLCFQRRTIMASYLAGVKSDLDQLFHEAFEAAWKDVVEPALKQSYRNGVKAGRAGTDNDPENGQGEQPRRRFLKNRSGRDREEAES